MFNHLAQINIKDKKMFNPNPVTQEFFSAVEIINGKCSFTNSGENKERPTIVIVLESPHRREYNDAGAALRSANGNTGKKLKANLEQKIDKVIKNGLLKLSAGTYNLYAVNAIQYQCSFGVKPIQPELRNTVFRTLWPSLKVNFFNRLKQLKPIVIINMCTGGIKAIGDYIANTANMAKASKYIKNLLSKELPLNLMVHMSLADYVSKMGSIDYYYCVHPSSKNFKRVDLRKV